jgi:hypothetical protein
MALLIFMFLTVARQFFVVISKKVPQRVPFALPCPAAFRYVVPGAITLGPVQCLRSPRRKYCSLF